MSKHYDTYLCRIVWRKIDDRCSKFSASFLGLNDYQESEQSDDPIGDAWMKFNQGVVKDLETYFEQKRWEETEALRFGQKKAP
jgi:hypothetical protein